MRDGSLEDGFGNVLDTFEALVENLDHLIAFHTGDGSPPEVVSHIENAKALASRGVPSRTGRWGSNGFSNSALNQPMLRCASGVCDCAAMEALWLQVAKSKDARGPI